MFYAGIDWADNHHDIVVLDDKARQVEQFQVEHSAKGFKTLSEKLINLTDPEEIACIIETSNGLLVTHLLEAGLKVYPVNPSTLDRKRKASKAKTDKIDAYLLARHGRNELDELRELKPDSPIIEELKILTRDQVALIQQQTRLVTQLTDCLKAYYPVALRFFSKLQQPVTLAFLQTYPTVDLVRAANSQSLSNFLKEHRYPRPNEAAQRILRLVEEEQMLPRPATMKGKARLMLTLVRQLQILMKDIEEYDQEIGKLFFAHSDSEIFTSLPGTGKKLGPRLLSEFGDDRSRFSNYEGVAALAGTAPVPHISGNKSYAIKRFACVKPFRQALYLFAWQSTLKEPWAKEYYTKKRAEGKSHSVAVRALSNVWVRIIYAMWFNHQPYDRDVFMLAQQKHSRKAA